MSIVTDVIFVGEPWNCDVDRLLSLARVLPEPLPGGDEDDPIEGAFMLREIAEYSVAIPLTEEWVLACALHNRFGPDGLRVRAAKAAVDRGVQRETLPEHLNPRWEIIAPNTPMVVKTRASVMNSGVALPVGSALKRLSAVTHSSLLSSLIIEEYVPGPQYEVNAVVGWSGELLHVFPPTEHTWEPSGTKIKSYEPAPGMAGIARELLDECVHALGLSACGVNLEWRQDKVIEVQARLGEDPRPEYNRTWYDGDPSAKLIELLLENRPKR